MKSRSRLTVCTPPETRRPTDRFIVKVQVSLATPEAEPLALIHNEDRSLDHQCLVTPELARIMRGRPKLYFTVDLLHDGQLAFVQEEKVQAW